MQRRTLRLLPIVCLFFSLAATAEQLELRNSTTVASFGPEGLLSLKDNETKSDLRLSKDAWLVEVDGIVLRSSGAKPTVRQTSAEEITYSYDLSGYRVSVAYRLSSKWHFVSKQLKILSAPRFPIKVGRVVPLDLELQNDVRSVYIPSSYFPQLGQSIEKSRQVLPPKDFGAFLRLANETGAMLVVENPFLQVTHQGNSASVEYSPNMEWEEAWGPFTADTAVFGSYRLTGQRMPREMTMEWHLTPDGATDDGMDRGEIEAFRDCVRAFLVNPAPSPISVEVGWTLNDYQIDVGTPEGKAEYKRIIDSTSALGVRTLLYAPGNSTLAERTQSADTWSWEYVLWLNMGQKIRKGEWDPAKDPLPNDVTEMVTYAKSKNVGLLAYVYPSVPYSKNPAWMVKKQGEEDRFSYATLGSREFQDYLLHNLLAFQRRTGIAGYSFDYTWLNLPGSSSYAQWFGWRRVMEELRRNSPSIVIDGRQSYQEYGPWSWLAGSYPHPTGNDEQPESFKPYPDLHFDRVSGDRARFVNFWYRNYQFAPAELIPGYATHQTERSINIPPESATGGHPQQEETVYTRYLPRDWDYLGYRYSFLSSIATGGWNNVVDMIPARDSAEWQHFSASDKAWIRNWLDWTTAHKEYLRNTRTILDQPAMGHVDGTSAIVDDHGFLFLFNPNYKQLPASFVLDESIGLVRGVRYLLKEIVPNGGKVIGKPGAGVWSRGDTVRLTLDGTSATVLELTPVGVSSTPMVFNAVQNAGPDSARLHIAGTGGHVTLRNVAGEPGTSTEIGVLLPLDEKIKSITVNGHIVKFAQTGRYASAHVSFAGTRFGHAEQVVVSPTTGGDVAGSFTVPRRILDQLAQRKRAWPIPWTKQDYETTWLAPERLLLFFQFADGQDTIPLSASLDGQPLPLKAAYSSTRVHPPSFVGFYADLSSISPDKQHSLSLKVPAPYLERLQGVFFDNVQPELTERISQD